MHHPNPASVRAEEIPDLADDLYLALLHSLSEGMCFLDPRGAIRFWNRAAEEISGFTATEALGARKLDDVLSYCDETGHAMTVAPVIETLADRKERTGRLFLRHKDGHRLPVRTRTILVRSVTGVLLGAMDLFQSFGDVTPRELLASDASVPMEEPSEDATSEFLTAQLNLRVQQVQHQGRSCGVLVIDIDGLGRQDRQFGREAGDRLLSMVEQTTSTCLRSEDVCGRWGDDATLVLLYVPNEEHLRQVADRLLGLVHSSRIQWWGEMLSVTVTIGGTMIHADDSGHTVVRRVEECVARGGANGGGQVVLA
jgi:diguanylate cyclase (GGDEF)-like protein/PAS domain S-box-containing protein